MGAHELGKFFRGKKVFVTGSTGFKGSWLCQILLSFGAKLSGYALKPATKPSLHTILGLDKRMTTYYSDVRDCKRLEGAVKKEKPEIVFHLAAQPLVRYSYQNPLLTYETNVMGTVNMLQALMAARGVKSSVMITTDKVYENKEWVWAYRENDELGGVDPYSASKACAELAIRSYTQSFFSPESYGKKHGTLVASARAGNVIGGGDWSDDRLVPDIVRAIFEKKEPVVMRNPDAVRPWQHVLDPLFGYMLLSKRLYEGGQDAVGAWNFAPDSHNCITVESLVKNAIKITGEGSFVIKPDSSKHEMKLLKLDATKAKTHIGWKPLLSIGECLDWTFDWYRSYYSGKKMADYTEAQIEEYLEKSKSC